MSAICHTVFLKKVIWLFLWAGLALSVIPSIAFCHRVIVFAWVEGDVVHTESKISGGKMLMNASIDVYDMEEALLLKGKTDPSGRFSFEAPKRTDMKIILRSDMGHQAEWTVRKEEFSSSVHQEIVMPDVQKDWAETKSNAVKKTGSTPSSLADNEAMETLLDQKLAPVLRQISELRKQTQGPSIKDILGGIGYIFGLIGVAAYVRSQRK
jgi:nickel transport protein